jgi:hypothetical protein
MNKAFYSAAVAAVVVLLAWWLFRPHNSPTHEQPVLTTAPRATPSKVPTSDPAERTISNLPQLTLTNLSNAFRAGSNTRKDLMHQLMLSQNSKSLDLFGLVVDQYGAPVIGAKVMGSVLLAAGFTRNSGEDHYTEADAQGRFGFARLHGLELGICPQKEGYEYDLKLSANRPENYYKADPNDPVVFTMWKLKGPEPMIHVKAQSGVPCDGSPARFDLFAGKPGMGGDLIVKLTRRPVDIVRGKPFDWEITVEIPGGGLQEIRDAYPNEAPAGGYLPSITMAFPVDMPKWTIWLDRSFYVKAGGGKVYGRMAISVTADFQPPPTFFSANVYANPSGSRNLEFDPSKQIR